jgi:hypothetical protein
MTTKATCVSCLLCLGLAYWGVHRIQGHRTQGNFLPAQAMPQLDYLANPDSFSRVENTKNALEALCQRRRLQAETKLIGIEHFPPSAVSQRQRQIDALLEDLRHAKTEFAGTEQEMEITEDLLTVLKRQKLYKQWIDEYVQALYERPMHPLIAHSAADAVSFANLSGQEEEVLIALKHAASIPLRFPGKDHIVAVLAGAAASSVAARLDATSRSVQRGS